MASEPLEAVLAIRRRAVEQDRASLAASNQAASLADQQARAIEREIEKEAERAADPSGSDHLVEAFAAWLPAARQRAAQARALQDRHEAESSRHRAELTASRTAVEIIETLIAERHAARAQARSSAAQRELDDIPRRPPATLA